jgi:hypothetical protein
MKPSKKQRQLLAESALASFAHAFNLYANGLSLEAILIDHDILAADAIDVQEPFKELHRHVIKTACELHDFTQAQYNKIKLS